MQEDTQYHPVDLTAPALPYTPYPDYVGIPPPPPKRRKTGLITVLIVLAILILGGGGGVYATLSSYQQAVQTEKIQNNAKGTASTHMTSTVISQNTSVAATHIAISATSTQTSSHVTATAIQQSINATVTASVPTPTPTPFVRTAEELYEQFIYAGIAMGNAGVISNSQWLQDGFSYYPGRGNVSFIDENSYGKMVITLFNTASGAATDASQTGGGWGTYQLGTCLLFYQLSSTNLTPYEQVMQQYCM